MVDAWDRFGAALLSAMISMPVGLLLVVMAFWYIFKDRSDAASRLQIEKLKIKHEHRVQRLIDEHERSVLQLVDARHAQARTSFKLGWVAAMKQAAGAGGPYRGLSGRRPMCASCLLEIDRVKD